jgi:hypothetical protein
MFVILKKLPILLNKSNTVDNSTNLSKLEDRDTSQYSLVRLVPVVVGLYLTRLRHVSFLSLVHYDFSSRL